MTHQDGKHLFESKPSLALQPDTGHRQQMIWSLQSDTYTGFRLFRPNKDKAQGCCCVELIIESPPHPLPEVHFVIKTNSFSLCGSTVPNSYDLLQLYILQQGSWCMYQNQWPLYTHCEQQI